MATKDRFRVFLLPGGFERSRERTVAGFGRRLGYVVEPSSTPSGDGEFFRLSGTMSVAERGLTAAGALLAFARGYNPMIAPKLVTPPTPVIKNPDPELAVEPTVVVPDNLNVPQIDAKMFGDPLAQLGPPSAGPGSGGGIGTVDTGGGALRRRRRTTNRMGKPTTQSGSMRPSKRTKAPTVPTAMSCASS